jgi:hypothetical protein
MAIFRKGTAFLRRRMNSQIERVPNLAYPRQLTIEHQAALADLHRVFFPLPRLALITVLPYSTQGSHYNGGRSCRSQEPEISDLPSDQDSRHAGC